MRLLYAAAVLTVIALGPAPAFAQAAAVAQDSAASSEASQGEAHGVLGGSPASSAATSPAALAAQIKPAPVMTPEQAAQNWRPACRLPEQYQKQTNAMTPAQRQEMVRQAYKNWKTMSTADKTKLRSLATAQFEQLPAADQQALERQALDTWRGMSAEEQQDLKDSFGLEGDLDLTGSGFESQ